MGPDNPWQQLDQTPAGGGRPPPTAWEHRLHPAGAVAAAAASADSAAANNAAGGADASGAASPAGTTQASSLTASAADTLSPAGPPVSYIAEHALLLHPADSASGASRLLLLPSRGQGPACAYDDIMSGMAASGIAAGSVDASWHDGLGMGVILSRPSSGQRASGGGDVSGNTGGSGCVITEENAGANVPDEPDDSDLTPLQCLASVDFWLLFTIFGTGAGCGLMLINNLGKCFRPTHAASKQLSVSVESAADGLQSSRRWLPKQPVSVGGEHVAAAGHYALCVVAQQRLIKVYGLQWE